MPTLRRPVALAVLLLTAAPGAARAAGEPVMPLADVHRGMRCVASTVVQGTTIGTFDVEILDVVPGDPAAQSPLILFRASGPNVDGSGIAEGMSGSPIRCPGADGVPRIAGAVSYGTGEYGGLVALATPIESILGEPVDVPRAAVDRSRAAVRARPLAEPLSFSGLSPVVGSAVQAAGRKVGRTLYAAPAAPRGAQFPAAPLVPGSSMAVGLSSGDIASGAIGTVSYVDGDRLWAFGHPLDSAGRRSLFLQDSYVYTVIDNPVGLTGATSYKLAAAGRNVGTLTSDGINAVAGRLGAPPPSYPMRIAALDEDRHHEQVAHLQLADESGAGLPTGTSALTQVGGVAVAQMAYDALQGVPARQSSQMCAKIGLLESPGKPLRFCNSYVGGGPGVDGLVGGPLVADFASMSAQLDAYKFGPLRISGVEVYLRIRRDLRQAFLLGARGPKIARRGRTITVRVRARRVNQGKAFERKLRVRVPRGMPRGRRLLTLTGTSADVSTGGTDALEQVLDLGDLLGGGDAPAEGEEGPRTLKALRANVAAIGRFDGVDAAFLPVGQDPADAPDAPSGAEGIAERARPVYRDGALRLSGSVRLAITIR